MCTSSTSKYYYFNSYRVFQKKIMLMTNNISDHCKRLTDYAHTGTFYRHKMHTLLQNSRFIA